MHVKMKDVESYAYKCKILHKILRGRSGGQDLRLTSSMLEIRPS